jgi:hypothetical protein
MNGCWCGQAEEEEQMNSAPRKRLLPVPQRVAMAAAGLSYDKAAAQL